MCWTSLSMATDANDLKFTSVTRFWTKNLEFGNHRHQQNVNKQKVSVGCLLLNSTQKVAQVFPKVAQKVANAVLHKSRGFQNSPKVANHLGFFARNFVAKNF